MFLINSIMIDNFIGIIKPENLMGNTVT